MKLYCRVEIPIRTISEANAREHWAVKCKRKNHQKRSVMFFLGSSLKLGCLPCTVKLTRIGKRKMDEDNLLGALKHVRDAVAELLHPGLAPGRADDSSDITWSYDQQIGKNYAVVIEIFDNKV